MGSLTDREIIKASDAIDKALASINKNNRGEVSVRILSLVRNLNDNIAEKIWCDIHPEKPCSVNKVGKEFINEPSYRFIGRFYNYLGKSVSHFTPTEDGAERLMLKYYQYVLQLKEVMKSRYTYQIEAIGFGNWFNICRAVIPERCISELKTAYRTSDLELKKLWDDVRKMNEDNVVLEETVRNDYSHVIDEDIFQKRAEDEIILCLNYNGLYGLNNINKLLQLNNPNPTVTLGIWQFKIGDPILFNDSGRFELLYNNLKGIIVDIRENEAYIYFKIQVDAYLLKLKFNMNMS